MLEVRPSSTESDVNFYLVGHASISKYTIVKTRKIKLAHMLHL